jgi:menaquinone-dependent protoporphyrinogen oxidase
MARILMLYETTEGQTQRIAERAAARAVAAAHRVELGRIAEYAEAPLPDCDAVLIAASVHLGRHTAELGRFIAGHRQALDAVPTAFLSVSLSATGPASRAEADRYIASLLESTGWQPAIARPVAGALRYSRYGFAKRLMMKRIASGAGLPTDTSRDHEFTDWSDVEHVVDRLLEAADHAPTQAG